MSDVDYDMLNPGIRETVRWLRSLRFETVDSGDGETHEYECDRDEPYVVMHCYGHEELKENADGLMRALMDLGITVSPVGMGPVYIQATYDPADGLAFIDLVGVNDAMLKEHTHEAS